MRKSKTSKRGEAQSWEENAEKAKRAHRERSGIGCLGSMQVLAHAQFLPVGPGVGCLG